MCQGNPGYLLAINFAAEEQNLDLSTLPNLAENIRYHRYSWSCAGPCIRSGSIYSDPYSNHWFVMKIQCDGFEALQGSILTWKSYYSHTHPFRNQSYYSHTHTLLKINHIIHTHTLLKIIPYYSHTPFWKSYYSHTRF